MKKYLKYFEYFLYYAPNVAHKKVKINEAKWEKIYLSFVELDNRLKNNSKVYARQAKDRDYYSEKGIAGNSFCFECQRMVFSRQNKEDSLSALLRHLRNSLAHGNLYCKEINKQKMFLFEDLEKSVITARIMLSGELLKKLYELTDKRI